MQVRKGEAQQLYTKRNKTILEAKAAHPERWRKGKTRIYALPSVTAFYRPVEKAVC
jgi:hypothetical protein